jgi:hypothetical protein
MDKTTWNKLKPDAQQVWDTLSSEAKQIILQHAADRVTQAHEGTMQVNQHESVDDTVRDEDTSPSSSNIDGESTTIEINSTVAKARNEAHPGDVRRVLGNKKKASIRVKFAELDSCDDGSFVHDIDDLVDSYWDDADDTSDFQ